MLSLKTETKIKKMDFKKEFDFAIYPLKLVITVGLTHEELCEMYENAEPDHNGEWGSEDSMEKEAAFANLIKDKDDGKFKILWNFQNKDEITIRNICHESFHIAMSVCQFCNMSLGFKVGEDEHAAYIAGFAGTCVTDVICEMDKEDESSCVKSKEKGKAKVKDK